MNLKIPKKIDKLAVGAGYLSYMDQLGKWHNIPFVPHVFHQIKEAVKGHDFSTAIQRTLQGLSDYHPTMCGKPVATGFYIALAGYIAEELGFKP